MAIAFWLNKLNQFNGNFEQAEMVKAFIVSGEYREPLPVNRRAVTGFAPLGNKLASGAIRIFGVGLSAPPR